MSEHLENALIREFELDVPLIQGPMGGVSGPDLVAAVANAGALGILPIWPDPLEEAYAAIGQTRALTDLPFAVNLRADLKQLDHISMAIDAGVSIIHLFWGDPSASMATIRAGSGRMIATVGDPAAAHAALDAGAVALIAQGVEAGGHVLSDTPVEELLASIVEIAGSVPVVAAGGCANAIDARTLIESGAAGVLLGTRFVATEESEAHADYKQAIIEAGPNDTARSLCFDGRWEDAPHRTLVNSTYTAWNNAGRPPAGERPGEGDIVLETADGQKLPRYLVMPPKQGMTGDIRAAAMYAGTGASRITDCLSAAQVIEDIGKALI